MDIVEAIVFPKKSVSGIPITKVGSFVPAAIQGDVSASLNPAKASCTSAKSIVPIESKSVSPSNSGFPTILFSSLVGRLKETNPS